MQIKILGTAAAEGWPAVFCSCDTCRRAREAGGKNIRSRASIQIGDRHKIDLPPDTWYHEAHEGADISQLEYLFISHSHGDHLDLVCLHYLVPPFAHGRPYPLKLYGNESVVRMARERWPSLEDGGFILTEAKPFVPIQAGGMEFTPVKAVHMVNEEECCLNYVFSGEGKSVLYTCDTSWYGDDTWEFLASIHLDAVISECTCGPGSGGSGHMDFERITGMKERLEKSGTIASDCIFIATHFSHNVGLLHDEIELILNRHNIQVAYDGMEITL